MNVMEEFVIYNSYKKKKLYGNGKLSNISEIIYFLFYITILLFYKYNAL